MSNLPTGQRQQHIIVADFDCHGDEPRKLLVEDTAQDCVERYANCIRFPTVSGNTKLGFIIETFARPTTAQAAAYLRHVLPNDMHWFDTAGMTRCYVNNKNIEVLKSLLRYAAVLPVKLSDFIVPTPPDEPNKLKTKLDTHAERVSDKQLTLVTNRRYKLYEAKETFIPKELRLWARTPDRVHLIQILTACWNLKVQFNLPQENLASQIGCSVMQVSIMLKELRNLEVLILTDASYQQGVKAQTYRAGKVLYYAIQAHQNASKKSDSKNMTLPIRIQDGQFWRLCLETLCRFQSPESFLVWLHTLDGLTDKRLREATRYAAYHFRPTTRAA